MMKADAVSPLAECRKIKGLTQDQLAELSGVTTRTIQRIESGAVVPQGHTLKLLAKALEIDVQRLSLPSKESWQPSSEIATPPALLPLFHILPLVGVVLPLMNLLFPLILWIIKKDEHPFYNQQGRQVIDFQMTISILVCLAIVVMLLYFPVGFPLVMAAYTYSVAMCVINTVRVLKGSNVRYPFSLSFMKKV